MAELSVRTPNGGRERHPLARERTTIGRSRTSDIVLPDQWLSRRHAEIVRRDDQFFVADLGSRNGTLLNGARITGERPLQPGDRITLGAYDLTFSGDEPADSREESADFEVVAAPAARQIADLDTHPGIDAARVARRQRLLAILTRTAGALVGHGSPDEQLGALLAATFEVIPAERGAVLLREGSPPSLVARAGLTRGGTPGPIVVSRSITTRVLERRESLLVPRVRDDPSLSSSDSAERLGIRSALCAPLWFDDGGAGGGQVLGVLYLDTRAQAPAFTEEDLTVLTALANLAAQRIGTLHLVEDALEKPALEADLQRAAEIQVGLLPKTVPEIAGYGLAGANIPCRAVGSDYYDFVLADDRLHFALADVAGKGTGAALLATASRVVVRAHWTSTPLSAAMERINRAACQSVPGNRYIGFFLGRLEPATGRLSYVNAGLNPPLLVRADGAFETLTEGGTVLGVLGEARYVEAATDLRRGDTLLAFSDGVSDTFGPDGREFGVTRLQEALRAGGAKDAASLRDEVLRRLDAFSGGAPLADDRTLIVLQRR